MSGIGTDHAPTLSRDFWTTDQMRDALKTRDMGVVVRAYRYHPAHGHRPLPQEAVSRWLKITQSQLSRIESGRNKVDSQSKQIHYAQVLRIPADLLWFDPTDGSSQVPAPRVGEILSLPDGPLVPAVSLNTGSAIADTLLRTLDHYATTDNLAGPRSLLGVVPQQFRYVLELLESARGKDRARLLGVAARYSEFEGWVYQDTGALDNAMHSSSVAFDYAQEAGDDALSSYILMRRSNIATDAGRFELALRLADSALTYSDRIPPRLRALALRQQAHVYAQKRDADECERALDSAFQLAERTPDSGNELGHYCTTEYLEMEAANCWVELGRAHAAIASLRQGLAEWQPEYRRDLGLCLARLSLAHAADSQPDHAVEVARGSLGIALETRSHRIQAQLSRVAERLRAIDAVEHARQMELLIGSLRS